jgi:hypothetical protein
MLLQLNPPIPLDTPKGKGQAHCLIDYSIEQDLMWVVFLDNNGECWTFRNSDIRAQKNLTIGRGKFTDHAVAAESLRTLPNIQPTAHQ